MPQRGPTVREDTASQTGPVKHSRNFINKSRPRLMHNLLHCTCRGGHWTEKNQCVLFLLYVVFACDQIFELCCEFSSDSKLRNSL